ncbi:hypothetical protein HYY72_01240 [Candidatus Woesearchaeota archaeon]|nr:hypothetical protein [Candidatus Woesearchaeota archaeon]
MSELDIKHMHSDIELLRKDVAIIKHILSEEGELTEEAKKRLEKARANPQSMYAEL